MKHQPYDIRNAAAGFGADLTGIASVSRFTESPEGAGPADVLPSAKSVIVLCCGFPLEAAENTPEGYTAVRNMMVKKMNSIAQKLAEALRAEGCSAETVPSIAASLIGGRYRGPISLKHAAVLAGLGKIGKNTLLVNERYGNMLWLSAVVTDMGLEPDPFAGYETCSPSCRACITACPAGALCGDEMRQLDCFNHTFKTVGGSLEIRCWKCRAACPNFKGIQRNGTVS